MENKVCTNKNCDDPIKPLSEFHKDKSHSDGYRSHCKDCIQKYQIENYESINKQQIKFYRKRKKNQPCIEILNWIKSRCNNPNVKSYKYYGGRGIRCLITLKELEKLYIRDKAHLMDRPSIDREDNDGDYEFSNCRFIELVNNIGKNKRKVVLQFDLEGRFIREWESITNAEKILNINHTCIINVAKNKQKTAGGFVWRYKEI